MYKTQCEKILAEIEAEEQAELNKTKFQISYYMRIEQKPPTLYDTWEEAQKEMEKMEEAEPHNIFIIDPVMK
jgi:hypothetical protein